MPAELRKPTSPPVDSIGDYRILSALSATAYRALGPGDKAVILKLFDNDCLQRGQLHPGIHARLSRVRELAHPGVANLHSVERDIPYLFAVWDDIDGLPIDRYVTTNKTAFPAIGRLAREVILVVESLHALGIVHGRITPNNVIVDSRGNVRLTHISPLLYDDPAIDNAAVVELLARLMEVSGQQQSVLGQAVRAAVDQKLPLRTLAARLSVSVDSAAARDEHHSIDSDTGVRWSIVSAAIAVAIFGLAMTWAIYRFVGKN